MKNFLFASMLLALSCACCRAGGQADVFDIAELTYDQKIMTGTLQGIANREGPRLYLKNSKSGYWPHGWPHAHDTWIRHYSGEKGIGFNTVGTLRELIEKFRGDVKGAVLYDGGLRAGAAVAATVAGLDDLLAVSGADWDAMPFLKELLPVGRDLRGRWTEQNELDAYGWALEELMPRCDRRLAYGLHKSGAAGLDYVVMRRGFVYDLEYNRDDYTDFKRDRHFPARPGEAAMAQRIMSTLEKPAALYGWGGPAEHIFARAVSETGNFIMCLHEPGLSFHAKVPAASAAFRQRHRLDENESPEKKIYVAFVAPEGDTPKILLSFMAGHWFGADRGNAPVNWGINPLMAEEFPAIYEYYFNTKTDNDYFYGGTNGAGYNLLRYLEDVPRYARHVERLAPLGDIRIVDIWEGGDVPLLEEFLSLTPSLAGLTWDSRMPRVDYTVGGIPLIGRPGYQEAATPEEMAKKIRDWTAMMKPPGFLIIYFDFSCGLTRPRFKDPDLERNLPGFLLQTARLLGPRYEAVTLDRMIALASGARE